MHKNSLLEKSVKCSYNGHIFECKAQSKTTQKYLTIPNPITIVNKIAFEQNKYYVTDSTVMSILYSVY